MDVRKELRNPASTGIIKLPRTVILSTVISTVIIKVLPCQGFSALYDKAHNPKVGSSNLLPAISSNPCFGGGFLLLSLGSQGLAALGKVDHPDHLVTT